ncbi:MAG: RodZ domain-containing protein [Bacillota bacterium]
MAIEEKMKAAKGGRTVRDIGERLRAAREARNLSLEQAQAETKIRSKYLQALESGQWDELPGPGSVYLKGFLRYYGNYLGLDGQQLVEEYKKSIGATAEEEDASPTVTESASTQAPTRPRRRNLVWAALVVVALLAGGGYYYWLAAQTDVAVVEPPGNTVDQNQPPPGQTGDDPAAPTQPAITVSRQELDGATVQYTVTGLGDELLILSIKVNARCWMKAKADGTDIPGGEGTFEPKQEIVFQARNRLSVLIGNLGGIELGINGHYLGVLGQPGETKTIVFVADRGQ